MSSDRLIEQQRLLGNRGGNIPPSLAPESTLQSRGKRKLPPNGDGTTIRGAFPRKRAFVACQMCRARKTKCDNGRPTCGMCQQTGSTCKYPDPAFQHAS